MSRQKSPFYGCERGIEDTTSHNRRAKLSSMLLPHFVGNKRSRNAKRRGGSGADYWPQSRLARRLSSNRADRLLCFFYTAQKTGPSHRRVRTLLSVAVAVGCERATTAAAKRWRHARQRHPSRPLSPRLPSRRSLFFFLRESQRRSSVLKISRRGLRGWAFQFRAAGAALFSLAAVGVINAATRAGVISSYAAKCGAGFEAVFLAFCFKYFAAGLSRVSRENQQQGPYKAYRDQKNFIES